jgi:hypothetical protein
MADALTNPKSGYRQSGVDWVDWVDMRRQWSLLSMVGFLQAFLSSKCGLIKHAFMLWVDKPIITG